MGLVQRCRDSITRHFCTCTTCPIASTMSRARNWCFTVNNPSAAEVPAHPDERYIIWQLEKGESGTEHWQGYVEFRKALRLTQLKTWLPTAHFEVRKGSQQQARDYCKKEEGRVAGPWERGTCAAQDQGARNDIEAVRDRIRAGGSKREIYMEFCEVAAKYPRYVDTMLRMVQEEGVEKLVDVDYIYEWQQKLIEMIESEPSERELLWVFDPVGNKGKTFMSKHLVDKYGAFYTNGGKGVDICYAYQGERVCVFDYVRDSQDYVNYGVIEQIKNGILFSHKYESGMKRFAVPHVVVFANFQPDRSKFSADRLVLIEILSDGDWKRV